MSNRAFMQYELLFYWKYYTYILKILNSLEAIYFLNWYIFRISNCAYWQWFRVSTEFYIFSRAFWCLLCLSARIYCAMIFKRLKFFLTWLDLLSENLVWHFVTDVGLRSQIFEMSIWDWVERVILVILIFRGFYYDLRDI
jgi:hypothetical protein